MLNLLHLIGFPVEVAEQVDENYHVRHEEVGECLWYFTVHREDRSSSDSPTLSRTESTVNKRR